MTVKLDRRAFLGGVGITAGAVVATSLVPLSMVHALPMESAVAPSAAGAADGLWHVDDMCGHWPPYAHPIGYGHVTVSRVSNVAPADPLADFFWV
jgi:hypothetical protein